MSSLVEKTIEEGSSPVQKTTEGKMMWAVDATQPTFTENGHNGGPFLVHRKNEKRRNCGTGSARKRSRYREQRQK